MARHEQNLALLAQLRGLWPELVGPGLAGATRLVGVDSQKRLIVFCSDGRAKADIEVQATKLLSDMRQRTGRRDSIPQQLICSVADHATAALEEMVADLQQRILDLEGETSD